MRFSSSLLALALIPLAPLQAQEQPASAPPEAPEQERIRVAVGPQLQPSYPGSDRMVVRPFIGVDRAKAGEQFRFSAPDEGFGFKLVKWSGGGIGPSIGFTGRRRAQDVGGLNGFGFTVEAGAFVEQYVTPALRLRLDARQGLGGHGGLVSNISADYVARRADQWLFSFGPRLTLADGKYQRAYFGVDPAGSRMSGLPTYRPDGGLRSVGAAAQYLTQFSRRVGIVSYIKYDRLVDDAARSPVVRAFGSPNQFSGGLALTYTFTRR